MNLKNFRVWNNGTMLYSKDITEKGAKAIQAQDYCLMPFSGERDSKGREIYAGDLVRYSARLSDGAPKIGVGLVIGDEEKGFRLHDPSLDPSACFDATSQEVIGNVYQNPEIKCVTEGVLQA